MYAIEKSQGYFWHSVIRFCIAR